MHCLDGGVDPSAMTPDIDLGLKSVLFVELVARGAKAASSVAEAVADVTVAMASVPGPAEARETGRLASTSGALKVFIDLSTSGPAAAKAIAATLAPRGIAAIDAPVSAA
jgi:3-hydroxyisobutyrate dehydrogenase-like beta-hydroxyacid dehydrogenase